MGNGGKVGDDFLDRRPLSEARKNGSHGHSRSFDHGFAAADLHATLNEFLVINRHGGNLIPLQPGGKAGRTPAATETSAMALTNGLPPPPRSADHPAAHVPVHLASMERALAGADSGRWTAKDRSGFEALAAHTLTDIRTLSGINSEAGRQAQRAAEKLIAQASRLEVGALTAPVDPVKGAELELRRREQDRKELKTADDIEHRHRSQEHREEQADFQQHVMLEQLSENERNNQVERGVKLAKGARESAGTG